MEARIPYETFHGDQNVLNSSKNKLYFVCSGNTCRSPMAEKLLHHALQVEKEPLNQLQTDSFGTSAIPDLPASENSVFVMSKVGLDLKKHRSKSIDQINPASGLAYFCMTSGHRDQLLNFSTVDPERVFLLRQWIDNPIQEIPDPFGMGVESYLHCRDAMVEAIPSVLEFLREFVATKDKAE